MYRDIELKDTQGALSKTAATLLPTADNRCSISYYKASSYKVCIYRQPLTGASGTKSNCKKKAKTGI